MIYLRLVLGKVVRCCVFSFDWKLVLVFMFKVGNLWIIFYVILYYFSVCLDLDLYFVMKWIVICIEMVYLVFYGLVIFNDDIINLNYFEVFICGV